MWKTERVHDHTDDRWPQDSSGQRAAKIPAGCILGASQCSVPDLVALTQQVQALQEHLKRDSPNTDRRRDSFLLVLVSQPARASSQEKTRPNQNRLPTYASTGGRDGQAASTTVSAQRETAA
jgi:hypothetical protein